ncbi:MAG TPA: cation:dicarboxylase symporter family transporter [Methanotrichaceae archaeon]|nr:cation:dicarboxylase symporter family transporter [Methanotrichaceae archaeon]
MTLPRLSFNAQIFIGILFGILAGVFFGDSCSVFKPFASAFIRIMQITVLPYLIVNLIAGIGGMDRGEAKNIAIKGGMVMLLFWALGAIAFYSMQFTFPHLSRASFFSTSEITKLADFDLIDVFIPYNIFSSLSKGFLPSIVLFSLLLGFALIGNENNKILLDLLKVISSALVHVNGLIKVIIPFGVFAIISDTAGTITLSRLLEIQVYFISLIALALLLAFLVLPLLTSSITPFGYRELLSMSSRAMILGMTTRNDFIILPLIMEGVQNLFQKQDKEETALKAKNYSEVLVPLAYSFPTLGAFASILFVLFTAWFYMHPLETSDRLKLIFAGIPSLFGSPTVSVQFLLDLMHLPADAMELFQSSNSIHIHFVTGLTCMSIFTFTVICIASFTGLAGIRWKRLVLSALLIIAVFSAVVFGLRIGFAQMLGGPDQSDQMVTGMDLPWKDSGGLAVSSLETSVYRRLADVPYISLKEQEKENALERIRSHGVLRVGYIPNIIPFAFFNRNGTLVGYDVQMAGDLARFLRLPRLEFVPVEYGSMAEALDHGYCDIIMSAVSVTPERVEIMDFSSPYMELHLAFVVPDWRADEFGRLENAQNKMDLKIAVLNRTEDVTTAQMLFPHATLIKVDSYEEFFTKDEADVLLETAEEGSALALLHPYYTVVQLEPSDEHKVFYAYPVAKSKDPSLLNLLNYWLLLEEKNGEMNKKFDYWILGKGAQKESPRWCIARDILHAMH